MFSRFFIQRPIFASVVSIVIVIAGLVTLEALPIAQYPEISPPTVTVSASYPGANARVVAETVGTLVEEQVNGVEGMLYMSSTSSSNGAYSLTVTFDIGTDLDMASVLVQNRVAIAEPSLPEEVKRLGVTVKKQSTNILLMVALVSPDNRYDDLFMSNYATLRLKNELARIDGVGEVGLFGAGDYSMRVWLDPYKLKARNLTTNDVASAIQDQNVQVAAGQIGQPPAPPGQTFQYAINAQGRLESPQEFENIVLKSASDGRLIRVKDVARVELGASDYFITGQLDGQPSTFLFVYQLPGANALEVASKVRAKMVELNRAFPQGLEYRIPFDTTMFVDASIDEVVETLFVAVALVFVTILVFLQDWRATLIPALTIPVSLIGTFAVMGLLGFTLNTITLFGIVLAIGIVVDDAIVVVENTTRNMEEFGLSSKEATLRAMEEVTGPVVATTLVLLAVFVPAAFLGGITGQLYRQFALTIAVSTVFSSINALTLSPALCAIFLRPPKKRRNPFSRAFEWTFGKTTSLYLATVGMILRRSFLAMLLFLGLAALAYRGFATLPTGFVPPEDQGYAIVNMQLPDAASKQRTLQATEKVNGILKNTPGIESWVSVVGYSVLDGAVSSNGAAFWVIFDPWEERADPALSQDAILANLKARFDAIQEALVFPFIPPAIPGLGVSGGFEMRLQDRADVGPEVLQQMAMEIGQDGNTQSGLAGVYTTFRSNVPQLFARVDRTQSKTLSVPLSSVFDTLQTYLGSAYVNDFNKFGRTYQVNVQADSLFRSRIDDIRRLEVRNDRNEMIPLGTLVTVEETVGPQIVTRYNTYPSASVSGGAAPGYSSGQALSIMEQMTRSKLPDTMGFEWTGMSYQEKVVGGQGSMVFVLAVVFVYLVLCAQYESWSIPVAVVLVVPLALLGTVVAVALRGADINVYTQIGIVLLVALASKNAILIVEFAKEAREKGKTVMEAALEAARLRFRPILMTSFAFILGVFPLVVASGAGAASRQAVGTAVFGGMIAATLMSVLFTPVFFLVVRRASEKAGGKRQAGPSAKE